MCKNVSISQFFNGMTPLKLSLKNKNSIDDTSTTTSATVQSECFSFSDDNDSSRCSLRSFRRSRSSSLTVSFKDTATAVCTISRSEYSEEEITAQWYTRDEYKQISMDCMKQVLKMEKGETLEDKKYCSRGLETYCHLRAISKSSNRWLAIQAVLDEQDYQHHQRRCDVEEEGKRDLPDEDLAADERIAKRYNNISSSCQIWANKMGFNDQRMAEEYLLDVE